jgi:hypothetical protein
MTPPIGADAMNNNSKPAGPVPATVKTARRFAAHTEAAIPDLEERVPAGISPLERALAERLRNALAGLIDCVEQLEADGLMVLGSTQQRRPHQLLKTEAGCVARSPRVCSS